MSIDLATTWSNPAATHNMVVLNLGILLQAARSKAYPPQYILSKLQEVYEALKKEAPAEGPVTCPSRILVDDVIHHILRLATHLDILPTWHNWPTKNGPREDGTIPKLPTLEITAQHLVTALNSALRTIR